ncbi:MAG: hypothetical protein BJ554DRAFT_5381 [Olpidium bornovanus]|uniref:Peroxin-12 n=1 Tax=Olpidium bornovanus TaxID=278681 RepID=A0A8H7ZZQ6_9FUNG|nr:MAG: hypothetical protein BJ554DRAFT_5381 [Olpidium bornovanus]
MFSRDFPSWSSKLNFLAFAKRLVVALLSRGLDALKVVLPTSVFFFRFFEWWYASKFNTAAEQQPIPPPPESLKGWAIHHMLTFTFSCLMVRHDGQPHPDGVPLPDDRIICPLCLRRRTNATAASSGYVFCYPCIYRHVNVYGECPVTKLHCDTEGLRKIYAIAV